MSRRGTLIKFGVFAVVSGGLLAILFNTMTNTTSGETRQFTGTFTNVSGLRPGDDVRAAGVSVGRVQSIEVTGDGLASVNFVLGKNQTIYENTSMVVRYQNLLGQRYLALVSGEGTADSLPRGATIPTSRTSPGFDLTALLNGFEPLFETLEPEQINKLSGSIIAVLQGEGGTIETLLEETASLTTTLADNDEVFGRVVDNLTPVLENLAAHGNEFDTTVDQLGSLTSALAKERKTIGDSLDGLSELSAATSGLVAQSRPDLARNVKTLSELSKTVVESRKEVGLVFDNLPLATSAFSRPMSHGSWLNIYICNLALDLAGSTINVGSAGGPYSEVCR